MVVKICVFYHLSTRKCDLLYIALGKVNKQRCALYLSLYSYIVLYQSKRCHASSEMVAAQRYKNRGGVVFVLNSTPSQLKTQLS